MRKKLIALAVMAASGAAFAQSSVAIYGVVDVTLKVGRGAVADRTQLGSGGLQSSRFGFRGKEDLGGGLFAGFVLEGSISPDSGIGAATNTNNQASGAATAAAGGQGFMFNRQSTVSLGGNWGEIRLGRQTVPAYNSEFVGDPFGQWGVATEVFATAGASLNTITGVRASNMIKYVLPSTLNGVNGEVAYWLGENLKNGAATEEDGKGYSVRLGYTAGPADVQAGYGRTTYASGDVVMANINGSYDLNVVKLWAGLVRNKIAGVKDNGWVLGLSKRIGAGEIRGSYSTHERHSGTNPRQRQLGIGYMYDLSKRTAVGVTWARVNNEGGSALGLNGAVTGANSSSSGLDLSIRHRF